MSLRIDDGAKDSYGLADYLLDNYGICVRGTDCFWGKDDHGHYNGCLRLRWLGRRCLHWRPSGATTYEQLSQIKTT